MLLLLIAAFALGYWLAKDAASNDQASVLQRIINALVFTAQDEQKKTRSKGTKEALQRVIDAGYKAQYGPTVVSEQVADARQHLAASSVENLRAPAPTGHVAQKRQRDIDNTSLLLYFGAFLFVASIGLFVAFADLSGTLRTVLVAGVACVMYGFGYWLHDNNKKLREVGLTFIGIGMTALPFVGLAAYYYVYDEEYGPLIWLTTSAVALTVYTLTLLAIRNSFTSYMLIAGFVSFFQASISILEAPIYYFIWGFIATGIILQIISLFTLKVPELKDSSSSSAQILVPLTLIGSFWFIIDQGYWQFAVSLLLAGVYYLLQFVVTESEGERQKYAMAAHSLAVSGLAVGGYAIDESLTDLAAVLLIVSALHVTVFAAVPSLMGGIANKAINVAFATIVAALLFSIGSAEYLTLGVALAVALGSVITYRLKRHDSFVLTVSAWVILSAVFGQIFLEDSLSGFAQAVLLFAFTVPLIALLHVPSIKRMPKEWAETLRVGIVILHVGAILFAFIQGGYAPLLMSTVAALSALLLTESLREKAWVIIAVLYTWAPGVYVVVAAADSELRALPLFTWSVFFALVVNIFISIYYKLEAARWTSAVAWLTLPLALGIEEIGAFTVNAELQMWLYLAVAIALSISRAIARGRIMAAHNAPLHSLSKQSSTSYEVGLVVASAVAIILAFVSTSTVAESTLVILLSGIIMIAGGTLIERELHYISIAPYIIQIALLRLMEPYDSSSWLATTDDSLLHAYVIISSLLAINVYFLVRWGLAQKLNAHLLTPLKTAALITAFVSPLSFLLLGEVVWFMPVTLVAASALLLYEIWNHGPALREVAGFCMMAGVFWLLALADIQNIEVYSHLLAALFGLYAYGRFVSNDKENAALYSGLMLGTATVPLALLALGSNADAELYGLWLLLESIVFFLVGITIRSDLLTRWGLYVSIAVVLYQLRDFGWALLAVIALVLIGVGTHRALNQQDPPKD